MPKNTYHTTAKKQRIFFFTLINNGKTRNGYKI